MEELEPLAVGVGKATKICDLGRSTLYNAMKAGELGYVKVGARRLVLLDELRRWLSRQRQGAR
jgi:excisionase family DNA binding protein